MKHLIILTSFILLAGCVNNHVPKEVHVPVYTNVPQAAILPRPDLAIKDLSNQSTPADYVKAVTSSLHTCIAQVNACQVQLKSCGNLRGN